MIESDIDINFAFHGTREDTFSDVLSVLDDEVTYSKQSDRSVLLKNDVLGCNLLVRKQHQYTYDGTVITLSLPCEDIVFYEEDDLLGSSLSLVRLLYRELNPRYVFGMHDWQIERIGKDHVDHGIPSPISDESLAANRVNYPTWLMVFRPPMVETYGREWLQDLPAARIEEPEDGAIMTVATTDLVDCESDLEIAKRIDQVTDPIIERFETRNEQ